MLSSKTPNPYDLDRLSLAPPSGTDGASRNIGSNIKESNSSNALLKDIREANKIRYSKLQQFEENQR